MDASKFLLNLDNVTPEITEAALLGVKDAAQYVLGESVDRVPHERGNLQDSARVTVDRPNLRAYVSYDTPYAVVQHEDMEFKHDPGRTAKYLEIPLMGSNEQINALIQRQLKKVM